jgi:hypothetical protein
MEPRAFRAVFKGITADNGTEFPDVEALERSAFKPPEAQEEIFHLELAACDHESKSKR